MGRKAESKFCLFVCLPFTSFFIYLWPSKNLSRKTLNVIQEIYEEKFTGAVNHYVISFFISYQSIRFCLFVFHTISYSFNFSESTKPQSHNKTFAGRGTTVGWEIRGVPRTKTTNTKGFSVQAKTIWHKNRSTPHQNHVSYKFSTKKNK